MTSEIKQLIQEYTTHILGVCFIGFTVLMQIFQWLKINILKIVVLLGTFALALAFAGNDLVNFIGVPSPRSLPIPILSIMPTEQHRTVS